MQMAEKNEYDITEAFRKIEAELIDSMMRNMDRHRAEEDKEGYEWTMWQAEQLKALEKYKKENQKRYSKQFKNINASIEALIQEARARGNMNQEIRILKAIKNGFQGAKKVTRGAAGEFFKLNDRKLDALIKATVSDMEKAETAILRKANDDYRKAIYSAQVYANTGAGTYEKAVDMATRDMLSRGLSCVTFSNGAQHTLKDYADMAIRTASKRAYLQGEGEKRQEWGITTVILAKRGGNPCPKCLPFVGKVLIDDVWSGGRSDGVDPETGKSYPLMSYAIAHGLYHPRCKDSHTTYFPGISTADDTWTREELEAVGLANQEEARQQYAKRQEEKYERLEKYSLDDENQKRYAARREEWKKRRRAAMQKAEEEKGPNMQTVKEKISAKRNERDELIRKKDELTSERKELEKKVYFDLTGTQEEMERLQAVSQKEKELESQIEAVKDQIKEQQGIYRKAVEERLIKDGVIKEIRLSDKMTPEAADEIENTLRHMKEKYGVMPKGIVFSPLKVPDATASYNWIDDKIYLSNKITDPEKYLEFIKKVEESHEAYREHYNIKQLGKERLEEAEKILADKTVQGYEREQALLQKAEAEIMLNTQRFGVRENIHDVLMHEYGHFIHRHASGDQNNIQKKNVFKAKELGGKMSGGDWFYEKNVKYSREAKVEAARISEYATENPYETFAEGFLAMEKGERIPDRIAEVISDAMKAAGAKPVENMRGSDIIRVSKTTLTAEPNTITEVVGKRGGIDRNYYGADGKQNKQISNNDHGNPKRHPYGKHGEHAHDYIYDEEGKLKGRPVRELTEQERKENEDII